jgi:hypothetical protein
MTTATLDKQTLRLPKSIADLERKLSQALNTPVRAIWPEGEKFQPADCPEAVARVLIQSRLHERLTGASIAFVFREEITQNGRAKGGVAAKTGGKLAYFTGHDFIIEFSHSVWLNLTPEQRIALVDHELAHCERDEETGAWTMRDHDVEEFSDIVARWGLWTPSLRGFGTAIEHAQIDLFAGGAQ